MFKTAIVTAVVGLLSASLFVALTARSQSCTLGWCGEDKNSPGYKKWLRASKEELERREAESAAARERAKVEEFVQENAPHEDPLYGDLMLRDSVCHAYQAASARTPDRP
jgi:hypothetical protein